MAPKADRKKRVSVPAGIIRQSSLGERCASRRSSREGERDHHPRWQRVAAIAESFRENQTMLAITAIIRVRPGLEQAMREALLAVARNARDHEPGTLDYFVSQDAQDPCVFTTYERYVDRAAMDRHNESEAVARFFAVAGPMLDGSATVVTAHEVFTSRYGGRA
jgi:quinol monooxygenase YgiN